MRGRSFIVLFAFILAACGGGTEDQNAPDQNGSTTSPPAEAECTDATGDEPAVIVMGDNFFEPTCIEVSAEQGLTLRNDGAALHSFTVENVDLDLDVQPGEETNTEAVGGAVEAGTYTFICKYHPAMTGELRVA